MLLITDKNLTIKILLIFQGQIKASPLCVIHPNLSLANQLLLTSLFEQKKARTILLIYANSLGAVLLIHFFQFHFAALPLLSLPAPTQVPQLPKENFHSLSSQVYLPTLDCQFQKYTPHSHLIA